MILIQHFEQFPRAQSFCSCVMDTQKISTEFNKANWPKMAPDVKIGHRSNYILID